MIYINFDFYFDLYEILIEFLSITKFFHLNFNW